MTVLPICPRCRLEIPLKWSLEPVTICMPCYSLIPENRGLSASELREKASRSTYARRRMTRTRNKLERARWEAMTREEHETEQEEIQEVQAQVVDFVQEILNKAAHRPVSKTEIDPKDS